MSYAIVTPSFAKDYERCRLLAESVMRNVEGARHYVLVDGIDLAQFSRLNDVGVEVIDARELMHSSFVRIPLTCFWLTTQGRLLRGWLTQQSESSPSPACVLARASCSSIPTWPSSADSTRTP